MLGKAKVELALDGDSALLGSSFTQTFLLKLQPTLLTTFAFVSSRQTSWDPAPSLYKLRLSSRY